jgi:hypothetical protein
VTLGGIGPLQEQRPVNPQPPIVQQGRRPRRMFMVRYLGILVIAIAAAVLLLWRSLLPDPPQSFPSTLSQLDKSQISGLCRRATIRWAADRLRSGDVRAFGYGLNRLFRQKIDRFIDDRDGTYRIYVVVYDKSAPDGFNPWYRHQVTKTNGHWTILRSY